MAFSGKALYVLNLIGSSIQYIIHARARISSGRKLYSTQHLHLYRRPIKLSYRVSRRQTSSSISSRSHWKWGAQKEARFSGAQTPRHNSSINIFQRWFAIQRRRKPSSSKSYRQLMELGKYTITKALIYNHERVKFRRRNKGLDIR